MRDRRSTARIGTCLLAAREPFEIEVRWIHLDENGAELLAATDCLSVGERERAERLRTEALRDRYLAAHVFQRFCLAAALGCGPEQPTFAYGPWGKPELTGAGAGLDFNLAHCEEVALLAVARDARVGVDLERARPNFPWAELAPRLLSARERGQLDEIEDDMRNAILCRLWTRKEAAAKSAGTGLTMDLSTLHVGLSRQDRSWRALELLSAGGMPCWLSDLPLPRPWMGALAVLPADGRVGPVE